MAAQRRIVTEISEHEVLLRACANIAMDCDAIEFERLSGGANNQVFMATNGTDRLVLKKYFRHQGDNRDRRANEYAFSTYATEQNVNCIAKPRYSDAETGVSIFDFIDGRPILSEDINAHALDAAIHFISALNRDRANEHAKAIPSASESYLSLEGHLKGVASRIDRLHDLKPNDDIDEDMLSFLEQSVMPTWQRLGNQTREFAVNNNIDIQIDLPQSDRCLSPSDFGFHNALLDQHNKFWFLDFEYAGWDDPAKMIADFFCQKSVPVPITFAPKMIKEISDILLLSLATQFRMSLLLPIYQIKWCCILLNEFLPAGRARRTFANGADDARTMQLTKSREALLQLDAYTQCRDQLLKVSNA